MNRVYGVCVRYRVWLAVLCGLYFGPMAEAGTWTPLVHTAPGSVGLMRLLSDGTVIAFDGGNRVFKLTPGQNGRYTNGTWTVLPSMYGSRLYFSSQVLTDGRVFVAGGEYGDGEDCGEVYDPISNVWTMLPDDGASFSDSVSEILPNGKVMVAPVGPFLSGETLLFDPSTDSWENGPMLLRGGSEDEASWVKLADESILTIDSFGTNCERYIPSLNKWINDSSVPEKMYDVSGELGAAFLLPNSNAFFIGATGNTAIYTPSGGVAPGTWAPGPVIPNGQGTPDAPAAMMPNGKILCVTSLAGTSSNGYPSPASFYEYDPVANSFTQVSGPTGTTLAGPSYDKTLLDLPDGTVLLAVSSSQLYTYQSGGPPLAQGQPVVTSVTTNAAAGSYELTGTQLNGISEGAAYGDDAQMNSNYPLIQLIDANGLVHFARTYNWSSTGVMTGATPVTTEFTLPTNLPGGPYSLVTVANGIPSAPVTFAPEELLVAPFAGFSATGIVGGPFDVALAGFSLTNLASGSVSWTATASADWLAVSPASGTVSAGGPAGKMTVSLAAAAQALPAGIYEADVWVTNVTEGTAQSVEFDLTVLPMLQISPPAAAIFAGGNATFQAVSNSGLALDYQWFNGTNAINGATNATLTLSNAAAGSYELICSTIDLAGNPVSGSAELTVAAPGPYQQGLLALHPFAYWPLEETSGAVAYDYVGANNGFYSNCVQGAAGAPYAGLGATNYACRFDGLSSYVVVPLNPLDTNLNVTGSLTMTAWILPASGSPTNLQTFFGHSDDSYRLDYDTTGHPHFADGSGTGDSDVIGPTSIFDGKWHQIAGVYDNSNTNVHLYVDGVLISGHANQTPPNGSWHDVWLGGDPQYTLRRLFKGEVCQAALFTNVLTPQQIHTVYEVFNSAATAPLILNQPTNEAVVIGHTANLSALAFGTPPLSYQWYFDGNALAAGTNSTLSLPSFTSSEAGSYDVVVNNSIGATTSSIVTLTVQPSAIPVSLTGFNKDVIVENTATGGNTAPYITQIFDAANKYGFFEAGLKATNFSGGNAAIEGLPQTGQFTSILDGATVFQFAPYTTSNVLYMNSAAKSGTLTLRVAAPYNSLAILATSANGGGSGTFLIHFSNGAASSAINFNAPDWYNNPGAALTHFGRIYAGSFSEFFTDNPSDNNPNLYQTTLNLAALGLSTNPVASLTFTMPSGSGVSSTTDTGVFAVSGIPAPPTILTQPPSQTAQPGFNVIFTASIAGVLPLNYQWLSNGVSLTDGGRVTGSQSDFLTITGVQLGDAASYQLMVSNSWGSVTSLVATLTVFIPAPSLQTIAQSGDSVSFAWSASPGSTYQVQYNSDLNSTNWIPLGSPITATNGTLTASDMIDNAQRFYRVVLLP